MVVAWARRCVRGRRGLEDGPRGTVERVHCFCCVVLKRRARDGLENETWPVKKERRPRRTRIQLLIDGQVEAGWAIESMLGGFGVVKARCACVFTYISLI